MSVAEAMVPRSLAATARADACPPAPPTASVRAVWGVGIVLAAYVMCVPALSSFGPRECSPAALRCTVGAWCWQWCQAIIGISATSLSMRQLLVRFSTHNHSEQSVHAGLHQKASESTSITRRFLFVGWLLCAPKLVEESGITFSNSCSITGRCSVEIASSVAHSFSIQPGCSPRQLPWPSLFRTTVASFPTYT